MGDKKISRRKKIRLEFRARHLVLEGHLENEQGNYKEALVLYQEGLEIYQKIDEMFRQIFN